MKLPGLKMSKETKNTLLGGVAGALAVNMESAANGLVAGYPQLLKDRFVLIRNGELLATVAPVGITWAVAKKKTSERVKNVKTGVMLYDLPKLLDLFAYRAAYLAGLPTQGLPLRVNNAPMARAYSVQRPAMSAPRTGYQAGKYVMKNSAPKNARSGIGRYTA